MRCWEGAEPSKRSWSTFEKKDLIIIESIMLQSQTCTARFRIPQHCVAKSLVHNTTLLLCIGMHSNLLFMFTLPQTSPAQKFSICIFTLLACKLGDGRPKVITTFTCTIIIFVHGGAEH